MGADGLRLKHSLEELPDDGVFYTSERTNLLVHVNGRPHLIMFGGDTWPLNTCQPSAGAVFGAPNTTNVQVARLPGSDTYVLQAPAGSIARLFDYSNTFAPVDKGLYRFDFLVTCRRSQGRASTRRRSIRRFTFLVPGPDPGWWLLVHQAARGVSPTS